MGSGEQRIDRWLFFARIVKSRTLAQKLVLAGGVRINREKIAGAARTVRPGDVLTVTLDRVVRVLKVLAPGERRGPAPEAATLYEDLTPPPPETAPKEKTDAPTPERPGYEPSAHPPSKRERRALDRLRWDGD